MPDLGAYAVEVVSAYVVSLALLVAVVVASVIRSRKVKRRLAAAEERLRNG